MRTNALGATNISAPLSFPSSKLDIRRQSSAAFLGEMATTGTTLPTTPDGTRQGMPKQQQQQQQHARQRPRASPSLLLHTGCWRGQSKACQPHATAQILSAPTALGLAIVFVQLLIGCCHLAQAVQFQQQQGMILTTLETAWGVTFSGWEVMGDCGAAYGIKCDSQGYVTDINLPDSGLTGSVPVQILTLSRLTFLNLDSNKLSGPLYLGMASLKNLTDSYDMSALSPVGLQMGFNSLQYLSLYNNSFSGPLPADLGSLTQLTAVYLNLNSFSESISSQLGSLRGLSILHLDRNNLTGSVPAELGNLDKLKSLYLYENQLTGALPSTFAHLTSLTELSVDSTIMCPDKGSSCPGLPPPSSWGTFCKSTCKSFCKTCPTSVTQPENPNNGSNMSNGTSQSSPSSSNSSSNSSTSSNNSSSSSSNNSSSSSNNSSSNSSSSSSNNSSSSSNNSSSNSSTSYNSSSSSSGSTGVIIGVVVVVVVVVVAGVVGFLAWQRKWCCRKQCEDLESGMEKDAIAQQSALKGGVVGTDVDKHNDWEAQLFRRFTMSEMRKATNNFSEQRLVGKGGFGAVFLGDGPGGQKWAVKRAFKKKSGKVSEVRGVDSAFKQEVLKLSRVSHHNLVCLLGYCNDNGEEIVVYEYVGNGSLQKAMHRQDNVLTLDQRVSIMAGVAEGLRYLHEQQPPVVHRDIKPDNILLDEQWQAKVADFGLLREMDQGQSVYTHGAGTPGYIDPDYWTTQRLTAASDVYSFGTVLLELITGRPLSVEKDEDMRHAALVQAPADLLRGLASLDCTFNNSSSGMENSQHDKPESSRSSSDYGGVHSMAHSSISSTSGIDGMIKSGTNDDSSCGGVPSGHNLPSLWPQQTKQRTPTFMSLRAWVASVRDRYGIGPKWASVVVDPRLQVESSRLEVVQDLLQIGLDCSALHPHERPTMTVVAMHLSAVFSLLSTGVVS